ncbi:MAG: FHIPEP family type III secretion protein [Treponema sp.]|nr:FHIPEP family type III secretion protein [Treponema sp.]
MALKIISGSYFFLTLLILSISYTPWRFKAFIKFPVIIKLTATGGLLLQIAFVLFSSFYRRNLSIYREVEKVIISLPASLCAILIIIALLCLEIPCAAKCARDFATIYNKFSVNSMPSKIREIYRAELNRQISEKQAQKRQDNIEKQIKFFEKMNSASKLVFRNSLITILIIFLNLCFCFIARKFFYSMPAEKAFAKATAITLWNGILFIIPFIIICLSILITCRFTKKTEKPLKINTKMHKYKATKSSGAKNKKIKKSEKKKENVSESENKTLLIELGYGLSPLIDQSKDPLLTQLLLEMKEAYPEMPGVETRDNINFKTWEYQITYNNDTIKQEISGTETFDIILLRIFESIQIFLPDCR